MIRLTEEELAKLRPGPIMPASNGTIMTLRFTMPWVPSVNHYWKHIVIGGKFTKRRASVRMSEAGERYQREAFVSIRQQHVPRGALKGRLGLHIKAYPPDRRIRDLDNLCKGLLDALKHAGVIRDDGDIDDLHVVRGPVRKLGILELELRELGIERETQAALPMESPMKEPF